MRRICERMAECGQGDAAACEVGLQSCIDERLIDDEVGDWTSQAEACADFPGCSDFIGCYNALPDC